MKKIFNITNFFWNKFLLLLGFNKNKEATTHCLPTETTVELIKL